jgi:tRNA(His) guanylyltransferase
LLFDPDEQLFGRKLRKYNSTLAGEASARFSLLLGSVATFDCRISQLPSASLVVDYFRWRNEDAARNALNATCYWTHRKLGLDEQQATEKLRGLSVSQKNELLFKQGINFNDVPQWQKRGIGLYWDEFNKPSQNPVTGEAVIARRRRITRNFDLPMKDEYDRFIQSIIIGTRKSEPAPPVFDES